jgi:hypothetical protein
MPVKTLVLGRDDRVVQVGRDRICRDDAKGFTPPGKDLAVAVLQGDRSPRATVDQVGHRRQLRVEIPDDAAKHQAANSRPTPGDAPDQPPDRQEEPHDISMLALWPAGALCTRRPLRRRFLRPASRRCGLGCPGGIPSVCHKGTFAPVSCCHACCPPLMTKAGFRPVWPTLARFGAKAKSCDRRFAFQLRLNFQHCYIKVQNLCKFDLWPPLNACRFLVLLQHCPP